MRVSLPLTESDGDAVTVWIRPTLGGWIVSDQGTTMMRLSYTQDVDVLLDGARRQMFERVLAERGLRYDEGQLLLEVEERSLVHSILEFGQAVQQVSDLKFWTRARGASTFMDDLNERLISIVGPERVHRDYVVPSIPSAADYPVDFFLDGSSEPLYVFGVTSRDKARLATIVLQHLQQHVHRFNSLIVFQSVAEVGTSDMRRLMNAANDMVDSLDASDVLDRKVRHRVVA